MERTKDKECPICGEMYSSQGLSGHLRFTHGLTGKEMKNTYREVVPVGGDKYERKSDAEKPGAIANNPVLDALRRISLLKQMKENANWENYAEGSVLDREIGSLFGGDPGERVVQETKETIEKKLEKARKDYREAVAQRAQQYEQADS